MKTATPDISGQYAHQTFNLYESGIFTENMQTCSESFGSRGDLAISSFLQGNQNLI